MIPRVAVATALTLLLGISHARDAGEEPEPNTGQQARQEVRGQTQRGAGRQAQQKPGQSSRRAVRIPLTAVRHPYGQPPYVLLVDPKRERALSQPVKLGPITDNRIEITSGLSDGQLLIVRGQHRVVAGDEVEHQPAKPTATGDPEGADR